ncbi:hypothetical protein HY251_20430 [bacterium]|nr:hypothetical protein [bacterium]
MLTTCARQLLIDDGAIAEACRAGLGEVPPAAAADESGARALLTWLVSRIARRRLDAETFRGGYGARSPATVIAERYVHFTAPCADLSGVAALLLARAGIETTLVLGGISRAFRPVKFQCGLELELPGENGSLTWVVGFGISRSFFYAGRFEPTVRRPWVFRRRPERLDLGSPFLSHFCEGGREELSRVVPGYDLERDLRDHVARSGRFSFLLARRRARKEAQGPAVPPVAPPPNWEAA